MEPELTIITPSIRPENLQLLANSLTLPWKIQWLIIHDSENLPTVELHVSDNIFVEEYALKKGISGNPQRNYGIEKTRGPLTYFLDDDNILHPGFGLVAETALYTRRSYVFNQVVKSGLRRLQALPQNMKVARIDTAQVLFASRDIGDHRWIENNYCADGIFIQSIYESDPSRFDILSNHDGCYYNYLR